MAITGILKFVQHYLKSELIWNKYLVPIPKNTCVIAKEFNSDDIIFKIGDGSRQYKDLPIFLRFSRIEAAYYVSNLDLGSINDLDHILGINEDSSIISTEVDYNDIPDILNMVENLDIKGNIVIPQIISTDTTKIGSSIQLSVRAYDILQQHQVPIQEANWKIGNDYFTGLTIEYTVPNDRNLIGSELSIEVEVIDKYNKSSRKGRKNIEITEFDNYGFIIENEIQDIESYIDVPVFKNISWDHGTHFGNHTYTLFIDLMDPNVVKYELIASDKNILVAQDTNDPNIFHVTYPKYYKNEDVYFILKVTNNTDKYTKVTIKKRVYGIYDKISVFPPIIKSVEWNINSQYAGNTYYLTINAIDPNNLDLTYLLQADDQRVHIYNIPNESNRFRVVYDDDLEDATITYTVKVNNSIGLSSEEISIIKLVIPQYPIIDEIEWIPDEDQWEQHSYDVVIHAHDIYNIPLEYNISCNNDFVSIVRNETEDNRFKVTYDNIDEDIGIVFSARVSNGYKETIRQEFVTVRAYKPPIIDEIEWIPNEDQWEQHSYDVIIHAHDDMFSIQSYQLSCNDADVTITQDTNDPTRFTVTYPDYNSTTTVEFVAKVTNTEDLSSSKRSPKIVRSFSKPLISNLVWDDLDQYEQNMYQLTIVANDPQGLLLTYQVTCDSDNVTIEQDNSNPSIFYISYPDYTLDTTVTFHVVVTDSLGLFTTQDDVRSVKAYQPPVIDFIEWDDPYHYEQRGYIATIVARDLQGSPLHYSFETTTEGVNITPDSTDPTKFHVFYPSILEDISVDYIVTVSDDLGLSTSETITKVVHAYQPPIIDSIDWDPIGDQWEQNNYDLTINAHDPQGLELTYNVITGQPNIDVIPDGIIPNLFHIENHNFEVDTNVIYSISVTNEDGLSVTEESSVIVKAYQPPVIDSIDWNPPGDQYEQNTYDLIVTAHDDYFNITDYQVSCNDPNVTVVQDTTNPNIFHVTYPDYSLNTNVTYTVSVTNEVNMSAVTSTIVLVNIYGGPHIDNIEWGVISGVSWPTTDQWEECTYSLTINAHDDNDLSLTYDVSTATPGVTIEQQATPNVFYITYPNINSDTNVTFDIIVTNEVNMSTSETITKVVHAYQPPVIDNYSWDPIGDQYEQNTYDLTINAHDDYFNITSYQLNSNNSSVTIVQDTTNPNVFHVTYPNFTVITNIDFNITVTNEKNISSSTNFSQQVNIHLPPTIDSYEWSPSGTQYEQHTYDLIIHATSLDNLPMTYEATTNEPPRLCTIEQDTVNPNIFHFIYPEFTTETEIHPTIVMTVSNSEGSVSASTTPTVYAYQYPVVDSVDWDPSGDQYEKNTYTMTVNAHDPNVPPFGLTYQITDCSDPNVTITQDTNDPTKFTVTYPDYGSDRNVTFTIEVTNDMNKKTSFDEIVLVYAYKSPVIDSYSWDPPGDQYEQNTYDLIITAHDPNTPPLGLTYEVSPGDSFATSHATIVQDSIEPNRFHITYDAITSSSFTNFDITVTNTEGLSAYQGVHVSSVNTYQSPVIDSIDWDPTGDQWEGYTYDLVITAHDTNNPPFGLTYNVTPGSFGLTNYAEDYSTIVQDSVEPNRFHITYSTPLPSNDLSVGFGFNIEVTNSVGKIVSDHVSVYVNEITDPVIDDITFTPDDPYIGQASTVIEITASNPVQFGHMELTYDVTISPELSCVTITQDTNYPNKFNVDFDCPDNQVIDFIVTVSNQFSRSDSQTVTKNYLNNDGGKGYIAGGYNHDDIRSFFYNLPGDAVIVGSLGSNQYAFSGTSNGINGKAIFAGLITSDSFTRKMIDDWTIGSSSNPTTFGYSSVSRNRSAATSNGTNDRGIIVGGCSASDYLSDNTSVIEYVTITSPGDAVTFGNSYDEGFWFAVTSNGIHEKALIAGGQYHNDSLYRIDYVTINSPGNAVGFGSMGSDWAYSATSNDTNDRAVVGGINHNPLCYINMTASSGGATVFSNVGYGTSNRGCMSSNGTNGSGMILVNQYHYNFYRFSIDNLSDAVSHGYLGRDASSPVSVSAFAN